MAVILVQSAFNHANSSPISLSLPAGLTPGNHVLVIAVGRNSSVSVNPPLTLVDTEQATFNPYQGTQCWFAPITAGLGQVFAFSGFNDWINIAVFEISGARDDMNVMSAWLPGGSTTSSTPPLLANADTTEGLSLLALSWDNPMPATTTPAGFTLLSPTTWQSTGNYHDGAVYQLPNTTNGIQTFTFGGTLDAQGAGMVHVQLWGSAFTPSPIARTVWDATERGAMAWTTGNLTHGGGLTAFPMGQNANIRSTRKISSPSVYWEITPILVPAPIALGFCNPIFNISGTVLLGSDANALAYEPNGAVILNGVTLATLQPYSTGNVVQVAVDISNLLVWFNVNGGNWNDNPANNPASGVGGISFSSMNQPVGLYAAFGGPSTTPPQTVRATFSGPFAYPVPQGFVSLEATSPSSTVNVGYQVTSSESSGSNGPNQISIMPSANGAWFGNQSKVFSPAGANTQVSGVTQESGVAVSGKIVRTYDRITGELLYETTSAPNTGTFTLPALGRSSILALALDPSNFNALVWDDVTPV